MIQKICTKCKNTKDLDKFSYRSDTCKIRNHCFDCVARYQLWKAMKDRCLNPNNKKYQDYGGRGISVCNEWLTYEGMRYWLENNWIKGLDIDRINNDGNYEPSNCRFVTRSVNNLNRRKSVGLTSKYRGVYLTAKYNRWHSRVSLSKKKYHVGYFDTEILAAKAYDEYVIKHDLPNQLNF